MRMTLHLVAGDDYPAYHQLARQTRLRKWRKDYAHLDEEKVVAELGVWLREPRSNNDIRERVSRYEGVPTDHEWHAIMFARNLLPLVQLPPAGFWRDRAPAEVRASTRARCPSRSTPRRSCWRATWRLRARRASATRPPGPAWPSATSRRPGSGCRRSPTATRTAPSCSTCPASRCRRRSTKLPVRFLARWDQSLLAYADRDRIIPPELGPLKLTLSGDQTVTVDGRVAASWKLERATRRVKVVIQPHVEIRKSARAQIRAEAKRTARFAEPEAETVEVVGV